MKINVFFSVAAWVALGNFSGNVPAHRNLTVLDEGAALHFKIPSAAYRYDSVKITSNYKFDRPVSTTGAAYARIIYPVFRDGQLNQAISAAILSPLKIKYEFKTSLVAEHPALSDMNAINNGAAGYRELATNFIRQFDAQAAGASVQAYWYADIKTRIIAQNKAYTALVCEKDYFTGGLHDLYDHQYLNFDNQHHRLISLISQFKPNTQNQLTAIAERIFRQKEGLSATQELNGYFFENNKFSLPANFAFTNRGLLFFYDYYEIKPFAAGTTELVIPYNQLKEIVLPGSILAEQMSH